MRPTHLERAENLPIVHNISMPISRWSSLQWFVGVLMLLGSSLQSGFGEATSPRTCEIHPTTLEGWSGEEISNEWVRLAIVKELGGDSCR